MKEITLTLKQPLTDPVDFSQVRLDQWVPNSEDELRRIDLPTQSADLPLGEFWSVTIKSLTDSQKPRLVLQGDHGLVNGLGHQHQCGDIKVEGDIGSNCGSCMTDGSIEIDGNAAEGLGAPIGSRGVGMNGGVLRVKGNSGDRAGHRMRRGEIWIEGNAGDGLASWQVAGSIRVGGTTGKNIAFGMRRGTLILDRFAVLPESRFSKPVELSTPFSVLVCLDGDRRWMVSRGDRSIDGIGEVWMPESPSTTVPTNDDDSLTIR